MGTFVVSVLLAELVGASLPWPVKPPPITDYQKTMFQAGLPIAAAASKAAEQVLLETFGSPAYHREIARLKDSRLASLSPAESLVELKHALESTEYGTAFGLGPVDRAKYPGMACPNVSTIDEWGYYPNQWQLKLYNSSLVSQMPSNQWNLYDGGEISLYNLKGFANPSAHNPSWSEASERGTYVTVNDRRLDTGNEAFGETTLIYRQSVVKERAVIISTDSGQWENGCNKTLHTPKAWYWWFINHFVYHCKDMGGSGWMEPGWHPPAARQGMRLHTIVQGATVWSQSLPRLLGQILSPNADVEPMEFIFYSEAQILGAVTMKDVKTIIAAFSIFGTPQGDRVVAFCRKYSMPLSWGLGFAINRTDVPFKSELPVPFGKPTIPAGRARILDISTVEFTNGTTPSSESMSIWKEVEGKVRAFRQSGQKTDFDLVNTWWVRLLQANTSVAQLRGAECPNTDLCFGTSVDMACVCRNDPDATPVIV